MERPAPALISVVIPMFNEQESVRPLLERLEVTLRPLGIPFEVVAVDDGSNDSTRERLLGFHPLARELSVVCLSPLPAISSSFSPHAPPFSTPPPPPGSATPVETSWC